MFRGVLTLLFLRPRIQPLVCRSSVDLLYFVVCRTGRRPSDSSSCTRLGTRKRGYNCLPNVGPSPFSYLVLLPVSIRDPASPPDQYPRPPLSYGAALGYRDLVLSLPRLSLAMREISRLVTPSHFCLCPSSPRYTPAISLRFAFARALNSMSGGFKLVFVLGPFGLVNLPFGPFNRSPSEYLFILFSLYALSFSLCGSKPVLVIFLPLTFIFTQPCTSLLAENQCPLQ